jgi:hypothetical protein
MKGIQQEETERTEKIDLKAPFFPGEHRVHPLFEKAWYSAPDSTWSESMKDQIQREETESAENCFAVSSVTSCSHSRTVGSSSA